MSKKLWDRIKQIHPEGGWDCPSPEKEYLELANLLITRGFSEDEAVQFLQRAYDAAMETGEMLPWLKD